MKNYIDYKYKNMDIYNSSYFEKTNYIKKIMDIYNSYYEQIKNKKNNQYKMMYQLENMFILHSSMYEIIENTNNYIHNLLTTFSKKIYLNKNIEYKYIIGTYHNYINSSKLQLQLKKIFYSLHYKNNIVIYYLNHAYTISESQGVIYTFINTIKYFKLPYNIKYILISFYIEDFSLPPNHGHLKTHVIKL
jgi:hypothetical protein